MPPLLNYCAHVCGVALSSVSLGAVIDGGAAVVCCFVSGLRGAVSAWRDAKPSKALGFKLVLLVCLSLGIQSRVCVFTWRQVVCVASVSSVVAAGASLPLLCQKHEAAFSVSSVWLLEKPSREQQTS